MRDLHTRMLAAVLEGAGVAGVAEIAAEEAGGPVAIVLPARGLAAISPGDEPPAELVEYVSATVRGRRAERPAGIEVEYPVRAGKEQIGTAIALSANGSDPSGVKIDREEVLRWAAAASLAEVAATDARDQVIEEVRGSLLEDLRAGTIDAEETIRRAARLGCDLGRGAVVLVSEVRSAKPRAAAAVVESQWEGTVAAPVGSDRIYALLPARGADDAPERTLAAARSISERLRSHGPAAFSSFCADPARLSRAVEEADLALTVIARDERLADEVASGIGSGVYRLLFRALASNPDEVRSFYEDTVAPLVAHDREYRTDLLGTLESYLQSDCNINATARAIFAHRHTVAHRLERIRALTGLDPSLSDDRERLGLGIKAHRILGPTLHK